MKLMTKELEQQLPRLYETDGQEDALAVVKYFTPDSKWTWYAKEYDPGDGIFFGLVDGLELEYGYFSLAELEEARGPLGLPIERDLYWKPKKMSELYAELEAGRAGP